MRTFASEMLNGTPGDNTSPQCAPTSPQPASSGTQHLLLEWNRTEADYPRDRCIHQLLEEQARRTPNATAVEFEGDYGSAESKVKSWSGFASSVRSIWPSLCLAF
jgi:non-ribosomal peptide synthetase component F